MTRASSQTTVDLLVGMKVTVTATWGCLLNGSRLHGGVAVLV